MPRSPYDLLLYFFFFSSRRRHTRCGRDWSSDCALPIFDVLGGAGFADLEQSLLGFRRRHTRESADLRVRQLTAGEGVGKARQGAEGARHADALAGGTGVEPDAPRQPRGARAKAGVPAVAGVEFADEVQ